MFEDRDVRLDLFALGLLVLVVFLALATATYNPADPPVALVYPLNQWYQQDVLMYPVNERTSNLCGPWGSLAAALLLDAVGVGAYYLIGSMGVLTIVLLRRRQIDSPALRTVGWIGSLIGFTTLAAMLCPQLSPGPVLGSGGYLGALSAGLLKMHFAFVGGLILAASLLLGGLLLCTDYVLVHLGLVLGSLTIASLARRPEWAQRESGQSGSGDDAEYEADEDEADEEGDVSIRVGGRKLSVASDDDAEQEEEEYEDDEDDDEEYEEDEYDVETGEEPEEEAKEAEAAPSLASVAGGMASTLLRATRGRRRALRVRRPPEPEDRDAVMEQLDAASRRDDDKDYELPSQELLLEPEEFSYDEQAKEVRRKARILEKTFEDFGYEVKVVEVETGPVIAQYEVELEAGLRLSKITGLADDVAIALRIPSVRIVAPIPGKNTVGIEVPNEERQLVRLREVMNEAHTKKMGIPLFLGKDVSGNPLTADLSTLPHLLIAGRTGTGKSVCLNALIGSILMTKRPDEVRFLMIDPKMVELSGYKRLPHLMHPVVTDMRKAEAILAWAVEKMEERYELLARVGVRHMNVYNQLGEEEIFKRFDPESDEERQAIPLHMPYIVIVADEIADLMMTAGKEVEQHIIRLAQKSRAVGIHLILATQKPTVDVITGLIKSNLPARIAFQVASRTDSRVVLDEMGAEKLLGNGDMLFLWPGTSNLLRGQGTFLSDDEINAIVDEVSTGEQHFVKELVQLKVENPGEGDRRAELKKRDDVYEDAIEIVIREGRGSVSLLQRALGIGYGRAARLIDFMAEDGIVGSYAGSQAREVLMTMQDWAALQAGGDEPASLSTPAPATKILPLPPVSEPSADALPVAEEEGEDEMGEGEDVTDEAPPGTALEDVGEAEDEDDDDYEYVDEDEAEDELEEDDDEEEMEEYATDDDEEYEYVDVDDPDAEYEDDEYEYDDEEYEYEEEDYEAESA